MTSTVLALLGGIVLLVGGATMLVRGAASLALRLGLTPLIVGLTVVAFGTSAPELVVSIKAALDGAGGIAVGNVVGSNIANVGLIVAIAALIRPLDTDSDILRRDLPLMLGASVLGGLLLLDGTLGRLEGAILASSLVGYVVWSVRHSRSDQTDLTLSNDDVSPPLNGTLRRNVLLIVGGLFALVVGARWLVGAAVTMATAAGVSNAVIGLTIVAVGTSLPELATSVVAAIRGQSSIAAGNVIGSNLFNILFILGVAALAQPLTAPGIRWEDLAVMLAFAAVLLPMMWTGNRLGRLEGGILLLGYVTYTAFLVGAHG